MLWAVWLYEQGLLAGSNWNNGSNCGSRYRNANNYRWVNLVNYIYFVNIVYSMKTKLIRVKEDTYKALTALGKKGESYDDIIRKYLPKEVYKDD